MSRGRSDSVGTASSIDVVEARASRSHPSAFASPPRRPRIPSPTNSAFVLPGFGATAAPAAPSHPVWTIAGLRERPVLWVSAQAAALACAALAASAMLLWLLWPPIPDEHRAAVHIPKSFDDLKALNEALDSVVNAHGARVLACFVIIYLNLQAWSLPGSMYMSILAASMYGYLALPLVLTLIASGSTLCYALSALLGPAILAASEKWRRRVESWRTTIAAQKNLTEYLIILRIAPLPPHWVVNAVSPHVGIPVRTHWISCFFGVAGSSLIHIQIGRTLDSMTSSDDFHLISWHNALMIGGVLLCVLIPMGLRRHFSKDIDAAAHVEPGPIALGEDTVPLMPPDSRLVFLDEAGREQARPPFGR